MLSFTLLDGLGRSASPTISPSYSSLVYQTDVSPSLTPSIAPSTSTSTPTDSFSPSAPTTIAPSTSQPVATEPQVTTIAPEATPAPIETGQESAFTQEPAYVYPTSSYSIPMKVQTAPAPESYEPPPPSTTEPTSTPAMTEEQRQAEASASMWKPDPYQPPPSAGTQFEVVSPPPTQSVPAPEEPRVVGLTLRGRKIALGLGLLLLAGIVVRQATKKRKR